MLTILRTAEVASRSIRRDRLPHRGPWRRSRTTSTVKHGNGSADRGGIEKIEAAGGARAARLLRHGDSPLTNETVGQLIGRAEERWPSRECIVSLHQNVRLTFAEVIRRADRLAAGLLKLGMKRGDRLGIWGPNDVEWYIASLGAARAGFITVAINPAYRPAELSYCLRRAEVKAVVSPERFKTQDYPGMLLDAKQSCPELEHVIVYSENHVPGTHRFHDVESSASRIEIGRIAAEQSAISPQDGCNIQFTSGSTGNPKATLISHGSFVNNSRQAAARSELGLEQRICLNVPFFHAFGLIMGQLCVLHTGCTMVLQSRSFDPVKSIEAIAGERCDVAYGTPTMWINMMDAQRRLGGPPLKLFSGTTGGAPCSPELFRRIRETFRFDNMKTIYGLTETTAVAFQSLPGERQELTDTTVGHLSDHAEVMVVDEQGSPVPFGAPGELWVRGYLTMMRYWADEENTAKTLTNDGWLKTGDRFVLREDGYGHVIGRNKDMLIRGGENVFPKEIEDYLITHPMVAEVYVIGAHDAVYGEEICACVRLRGGARLTGEELKRYCKGQIAHYKIPRYVEFVDRFPKTSSGKVQKFLLKEEMERRGAIPGAPDK